VGGDGRIGTVGVAMEKELVCVGGRAAKLVDLTELLPSNGVVYIIFS
jgi:hypothetical protein